MLNSEDKTREMPFEESLVFSPSVMELFKEILSPRPSDSFELALLIVEWDGLWNIVAGLTGGVERPRSIEEGSNFCSLKLYDFFPA